MNTAPELTALSAWVNTKFPETGALNLLESDVITRVRSGLGGSHTVVTYPPLDALDSIDIDDLLRAVVPIQDLNLYVHIAFCEHLCPFCHYAKTYSPIGAETPLVTDYLKALAKEIDCWTERLQGSLVRSIYIGGGTPTALSEGRLLGILAQLNRLPSNSKRIVCVESSPLTLTATGGEAKLRSLLDAGIQRVSLGIQTFDEELLHRTRGHGVAVAQKSVEVLVKAGVDYNIDLIQDFPHQTGESVIRDLEWIRRLRPPQVTWYALRLHEESPWFRTFRRGDLELPTARESSERRLLIREGMRRLNYTALPGGRFVSHPSATDLFKEIRGGSEFTLLGMGVSAYSHGWGYFFRNDTGFPLESGIRSYIDRMGRDRVAVGAGLRLDALEIAASRVVVGIRYGLQLEEATPQTASYWAGVKSLLSELEGRGLVAADSRDRWTLTELGFLFEEEICSLFYSSPVVKRLRDRGAYWLSSGAGGWTGSST